MRRSKYWIQTTGIRRIKHRGALHKQLKIPQGRKIPSKLLTEISKASIGTKVRGHRVTGLLKKRAVLARTLRRY